MPYMKVTVDDQICVFRRGEDGKPTGRSLGCHDTEAEANAQIAAIEASEAARRKEWNDRLTTPEDPVLALRETQAELDRVVQLASLFAWKLGLETGIAKDHSTRGGHIFIDLPGYGQVSWPVTVPLGYVSPYSGEWDGHSINDRIARITDYILGVTKTQGEGQEETMTTQPLINDSVSNLVKDLEGLLQRAALDGYLIIKDTWTAAYVNDLPDSSFLYIEPGGEKDDEGKTVPRTLRHLPVKDKNGKVDLPHVRNALSRLGQPGTGTGEDGWLTASLRKTLRAKAERLLEEAQKGEKSAYAPLEDADGICYCPECGYEAPHTRGEPCADRTCPKCGAYMLRKPNASDKGLLERFRDVLSEFANRLGKQKDEVIDQDILAAILDTIVLKGSAFLTFKQKSGEYRWVGISSTAFMDCEHEIVSTVALQKSAEDGRKDRGPLLFWHEDIPLGTCDFAVHDGVCLIESGLWRSDEIGTAVRKYAERHPEEIGLSIGFILSEEGIEKDAIINGQTVQVVYNDINIVERSLLPIEWAANGFTGIHTQGDARMNSVKAAALRKIVGDELANRLIEKVDELNEKATSDPGAVIKATDTSKIVEDLSNLSETLKDDPEALAVINKATAKLQESVDDTIDVEEEFSRRLSASLEEMPECALKQQVKALLQSEKTAEDTPEAAASNEQAVLVDLVKELTECVGGLERSLIQERNSTRVSAFRPSVSLDNVDPDAEPVIDKMAMSKGAQILSSMVSAAMDRTVGGMVDG